MTIRGEEYGKWLFAHGPHPLELIGECWISLFRFTAYKCCDQIWVFKVYNNEALEWDNLRYEIATEEEKLKALHILITDKMGI